MSVRPISVGEELKGEARPFTGIFALMGASQGLLIHLHRHRLRVNQNWFSVAPVGLTVMMVGGFLVGTGVSVALFADWNLIRLANTHKRDQMMVADGQSIKNYSY